MVRAALLLLALVASTADAFTLTMNSDRTATPSSASRRTFLSSGAAAVAAAAVVGTSSPNAAVAGPQILNTDKGVKYAVLKMPSDPKKAVVPQQGDIVAIEYTGYLTDGQIFDATHSEGKKNALLFKLGSTAVIPGLNDMVSNMVVGQKVQAIIPPSLAFGDDGICLEGGECLVKPGSTLVYDVTLKKSSIPPP